MRVTLLHWRHNVELLAIGSLAEFRSLNGSCDGSSSGSLGRGWVVVVVRHLKEQEGLGHKEKGIVHQFECMSY